jgi:hypothetical protein
MKSVPENPTPEERCVRWAEKQSHLCLYCRQVQPARTQALLDQILANLRDRDPLAGEKSDPRSE